VERVLLTHGHLDHVGAAGALAKHYAVPIEGPHPADAYWLDALPDQAAMFGLPTAAPCVPDRWLSDGDSVSSETSGSRSCTARGTRPATWSFTTPARSSPSWATCCSQARSGGPISPAAISGS